MFATGSFFVASTLKQTLEECKTFDFSVFFAGISPAVVITLRS